ncbi:AfsR/SARP family transcriptional regulator [Saccharothrix syringae]|uniref:Tetratricopeptide repeat protein n=1 Tax=Saccharothrix syringae TaxID=103733 RepID=A0A5Q0H4W9_SACSY|nr:BTAD domain-containing putative transcriptional regulator [Saccharothrix syringae]QFZ21288.1 tetratricopeptide repeat protein [Saccharothrix syringae]
MAAVVRLLGEVAADVGGTAVDLGPARQRCVVAALAVDAGRVVPVERLVERVWGLAPPRRARATLHSYVSRLRQVLGPERLVRRAGGYLLDADRTTVDLHRFRELCARARAAGDQRAESLLVEALRLWRGDPLTGLAGEWAETARDRLRRERLTAENDLVDVRLRAGRGGELVAELSARVAEHPLDERVAAQYLQALYRAGRTADALAHYRLLRTRLAEELGTDPGAELRRLHQQVLDADPALTAPRPTGTAPAHTAPVTPVPRQLPPPPPGFVGRADELAALSAHLDGTALDGTAPGTQPDPAGQPYGTAPPGRTVVISAVAGAGGIGKTWLALHWAHRNAHRFPDGQLFVDLRGFSPAGTPMDPSTALRGFLDALGVEPRSVPTDPHAQAGLYRSLMADRRILVVADNARDNEQVVPLLPGSPTCTVLVTSRQRLTGLVSGHGARLVRVDVLSDDEARQVLVNRLGAERVAAEPEAVAELLLCCKGFPLALGVVVGRAVAHPEFPLAALAEELREAVLDPLDDDNPPAGLRAVLSWSVQALAVEQARVLALLGLAPGPDIGLHAAAALVGLPGSGTRSVLRALENLHLVEQHSPARWRMHDLVKTYAAEQAHRELPEADRARALARLVDHHLHTAHAADRLLHPYRPPIRLPAPHPGSRPRDPGTAGAALDWFTAERHNLLALVREPPAPGTAGPVWRLAWALDTFLYRQGHLDDAVEVWRAGLADAERYGDPAVRTLAHRLLGAALTYADRLDPAAAHLTAALALAEGTGDLLAQAHTHRSLAQVAERQGRGRDAVEHATRALGLYRGLGLSELEALALNAVGWYLARVGDHERARAHCEAALELARGRHHEVEAAALDSLAYIAHRTGGHDVAVEHYRHAIALFRLQGDVHSESGTLERLGRAYRALGRTDEARRAWRRAVELYRAQHRAEEARAVVALLHELDRDT